MTIKEIETVTGMTRANIRFYEAQGLLSPARSKNGYRDYSEYDVEVLKRIRLLRMLHISLEEIKALQNGELELTAALDQQLEQLKRSKAELEQSQEVCRVMRGDQVSYQTLDAQHYLNIMEHICEKPLPEGNAPELRSDVIPKVRAPWRRFFARSLDLAVYSTLWSVFLALVVHINLGGRGVEEKVLDAVVEMLLMLLIEPLLLSCFGTTIGKWIFGLSVTDNDGRRLSYREALSRTWTVLWRGMGLEIPLYGLIRKWKSYKDCRDGWTLEWEYDSTLVLRDEKKWRFAAWAGSYAVLFGVLFLAIGAAGMPKYRGDITVAQFCDNYNRLADYYDMDGLKRLDSDGNWIEKNENGVVVIYESESVGCPDPTVTFTEENGILTGVSWTVTLHNSEAWVSSYQNEMQLAAMAFVGAQKDCLPLFGIDKIQKQITEHPFADFQFSSCGISVSCDVEQVGYADAGWYLIPEENTETEYHFCFAMEKE